ncbi:hypothetical protein BT96DRAFT_1011427 [Gymnopus androsaceus JB14]|uniref:MYND-type domain-containing protein n=1 Tax=Gymnopus androsaceus JB14 TaxID=1447944 RepID=A0A6A4IJ80_9AGAR|nr:hypothetical protein BT96DRAFT_1011427 [Gymnopus androsaceus JB14]
MRQYLGRLGAIKLADGDFESKWMQASVSTRQKHVLVGISEAGNVARNINEARRFAFDVVRLEHLSQDGKTYLDLFKSIMPNDLDTMPKEPYCVPDGEWDSFQARMKKKHSRSKVHLRDIVYCSKECQVADYETSHKVICGKVIDVDAATQHAADRAAAKNPTTPQQIPPAIAGFKRSPHLLRHVQLLNKNPGIDLYKIFRPVRDKAMTTGDRDSIVALCFGRTWNVIYKQMENELEMPDLKEAILELQKKQSEDAQRPPLLLNESENLPSGDWDSLVEDHKFDLGRILNI